MLGVTPLAHDDLGRPQLLVAAPAARQAGTKLAAHARDHVARLAPAWRVDADALPALKDLGVVNVAGGSITRLGMEIDGLQVEGELRVMTRSGGELVAINGALVGTDTPRSSAMFRDNEASAIARAVAHTHHGATDAVVRDSLARRMWVRRGDALVAAWIVDAYSRLPGDREVAYRTILRGHDGAVLAHESLTQAAAHQYRVFATAGEVTPADSPFDDFSPHPSGVPDQVFPDDSEAILVEVDGLNHPAGQATPDPWLPPGANATTGNNVDVYADVQYDGVPDFRPSPVGNTFDFTYDLTQDPLADPNQQSAVMTQLFYTVNYLHDFWYDAGFTEAAGNGQADNLGRGGVPGDPVVVVAQAAANFFSDNAFMTTPADGMSPTMNMFLWSPAAVDRTLVSIAPAMRYPEHRLPNTFGPTTFDVTESIVIGTDGGGADPNDGCEPFASDVSGKIVLVRQLECPGQRAVLHAQEAGARGVLLAMAADGPLDRPSRDPSVTTPLTIPSVSIRQGEGDQLETELATGAVSVHLRRRPAVRTDGGLDATVVAHEFGHYIHHRLQNCGFSGYCGALSEGWGDLVAMLLMVREGDDMGGAYPLGAFAFNQDANSPYFGLRRTPYSASRSVNALRYGHMRDDTTLPTTHPIRHNGQPNSQIHNAGSVWASALFEVYAALQAAHPGDFAATRKKMAQYMVAGLMLAPTSGTATEVRDALLAAIAAADPADAAVAARAFAGRGFGTCAESGPRYLETFGAVRDDSSLTGRVTAGDPSIERTEDCDGDPNLDAGETFTITLPITNTGTEPLTNVRVIAAADSAAAIASEPVVLATLAPHESRMVTVRATLADNELARGELVVQVDSPDGCATTSMVSLPVRLNVDTVPAASAADSFDSDSVWTTEGDAWKQVRIGSGDRAWHAIDPSMAPTSSLVSPPMTVPAGAAVVVAFSHRHDFSIFNESPAEGGVIEITTDGGATWQDVNSGDPRVDPYDDVIDDFGSMLVGRRAFTGRSEGYPVLVEERLDFGTKLAGTTFQLRFVSAPVPLAPSSGWEVDKVVVTGISDTPFPSDTDETETCAPPDDGMPTDGSDTSAGGCCQTPSEAPATSVVLGLGLAALLAPRRRRRSATTTGRR